MLSGQENKNIQNIVSMYKTIYHLNYIVMTLVQIVRSICSQFIVIKYIYIYVHAIQFIDCRLLK